MKRAHENVLLFHWAMDNRIERERWLERKRAQERENRY